MHKLSLADRLRKKLFIYFALALLCLALCVAGAVALPLLHGWKNLEENTLLQNAQFKATAAAEWLRQNRHLARQLAARTGMRQELELLNTGQKSPQRVVPFIMGAIQDSLRQTTDVLSLVRLDNKGKVVAAGGVPVPPEYFPPRKGGEPRVHVSAPVQLGNKTAILFSTAIINRQQERIGTDIMAVSTESLLTLLHDSGLNFLATRTKGELYFFEAKLPTGAELENIKNGMYRALRDEKGVSSDRNQVLAYVPVPESPWAFVTIVDSSSLYAPAWANLTTMLLYIGIVYVLCLLGFCVLVRPLTGTILVHTHELENSNAALRKEQSRRQQLSGELINLIEEIRKDISRDLHDHTGQLLTTLRLQLESLRAEGGQQAPQSAERLATAAAAVTNIQRTLKSIARGLRPPCLDYLGLVPSLETLLEEYRQAGLSVHFFHKNISDMLDAKLAVAFYRIAQEALTNVLRHACASQVHVNFTCQKDIITLSIEDNGKGFDAAAALEERGPVDRLGLTLMQERMILFGGECLIESAQDKGTQIMAQCTVPKEEI